MIKPKYTTYSLIEEQNVMREMMGLAVLVEQNIKVKDGKSKIKIKPKGDKSWQLITTKDFQFDPNNLTADSEVFHQIKRATKIGDLTPEQVMISSKKDGKRRDVSLFMIIPKLTPPEQEEEIRQDIEIKVKNENPDGIKLPSDEVGATATEEKILTLTGDKSWEYKVEDEIWYTRKQGSDGKWISLKTNKKAQSILDKKFPDAREAQEEIPADAVEGTLQKCGAGNWNIDPLGGNKFKVTYIQQALFSKEPKKFEITTAISEDVVGSAQDWDLGAQSYWDGQIDGEIETQKTDNTKSMEFILDMNIKPEDVEHPRAGKGYTRDDSGTLQPPVAKGIRVKTGAHSGTEQWGGETLQKNIKFKAIPLMVDKDGSLVKNGGCEEVVSEAVLPEDAVASTMSEAWAKCPCIKSLPDQTMTSGVVTKRMQFRDEKIYIFDNCRAHNAKTKKRGRIDCESNEIIYDK